MEESRLGRLEQAAATAAEAHARSERRFRTLVEFSSDVITLLDAAGVVLYSTQSLKPTLGYEQGEMGGRNVFELVHPEDRPAAERLFRDVARDPTLDARAELRVRHREGGWRDLEVVATNQLSNNDIAAVVVIYRDVTERKRAERALREANHRLHTLIESSPLAITSIDENGVVGTWNTAAHRLFGWTAQEALGTSLPIVPEDKQAEFSKLRRRVMGGESLSGVELVQRTKDGSPVIVKLFAAPLRDAAGRVTGALALLEDLSGVKRLEQQFFQAQKMEAVGRLAAGVAHDFNNLLTAILGSADFLLDMLPANHPGRQDAEEMRKAARRAADLTRQLLAFSRLQVLTPRVLDLNDLVADLDKILSRLLGEGIDLRTALAPDLGAVRADAAQLEQVIINLAVNARDAMPDGGKVTIETANASLDDAYVAARPVVAPGRYVMLAVSDTGVGMDDETKARAFEPFYTTKPKGKGTGLGLATVYGIVKQSGGYVWSYSEPGRGATFKIYLPRVDALVESAAIAPVERGSVRGSETIILCEDQEDVRSLTYRILAAHGYEVIVAASGQEALRLAEEWRRRIHLLVTDVVMPGMSGREVALLLGPAHPTMKVLYLSGYPDESIARHGVLEPGVAFLQKPFTAEMLARRVREVLDRR
jgi:PAS domain S-box-containing protein